MACQAMLSLVCPIHTHSKPPCSGGRIIPSLHEETETQQGLPMPTARKQQDRACTLAGVAQWIERRLVDRKVASLIPSQGSCLGWG